MASGKAKHGVVGRRLQLAFAAPTSTFRYVEVGSFMPAKEARVNKVVKRDPSRVTWCLRRMGRIRMPFASDILDRYVAVVSRNAFDLDFTEESPPRTSRPQQTLESVPAVRAEQAVASAATSDRT